MHLGYTESPASDTSDVRPPRERMTMRFRRAGSRRARAFWFGRSPQAGFSLIELIVTIVILAIGIVGVLTMFLCAYQSQLNAHYTMLATAAAVEKLEEMRSAGYNGINSVTFASPFALPDLPGGVGTIAYTPFPEATSDNLYRITVQVQWQGGRNIQGNTSVSSLVALHP